MVDENRDTLEKTAEAVGIEHRFQSLDDALTSDFDAVIITTPTFTHPDFAVEAARAGKHDGAQLTQL